MSKYPWYIEFESENDVLLKTKYVGFARPENDDLCIAIDDDDKAQLAGCFFAPQYHHFTDGFNQLDWSINAAGKIIGDFRITTDENFDFSDEEIISNYLDLAYSNIINVVNQMLIMQSKIGDIWKMPDMLDCALYAQTEAIEFIESVLLQVRSSDSRNNKKAEDFDSATEMFDVTMMLLRSLIAHEMARPTFDDETEDQRTERILDTFHTYFVAYKDTRLRNIAQYDDVLFRVYRREPETLSKLVGLVIDNIRFYEESQDELPEIREFHNSAILQNIIETIFFVCEFVIFHPIVQFQDYNLIANRKLDKIYNKSMAKKATHVLPEVAA